MKLIRFAALVSAVALIFGCEGNTNQDNSDQPQIHSTMYQHAISKNPIRPKEDFGADKRRKPAQILEFAGVKEGDVIADLLGGGGWYTEILSAAVGPTGRVYLVNSPLFINFTKDKIQKRLKDGRLQNVERIDGPWSALGMPENSLDIIWLSLAYHDIYVPRPENAEFEANPDEFFEQMYKALKAGGKILVIDHADAQGMGNRNSASLHRIEEAFAIKDFEQRGFILLKTSDLLRNAKDDYTKDIWKKSVIHKTDKFVHLYIKPN